MTNLLEETLNVLAQNGKTKDDVRWVGSADGSYAIPWAEFERIANVEHADGFGWAEVNEALVVVGDDWHLQRREYDGREWWEFKTLPKKRSSAERFDNVLRIDCRDAWQKPHET